MYRPFFFFKQKTEYEILSGLVGSELGIRNRVKVLGLQVGDIQIFKGRFSVHRVAPTQGQRHTAIFGYSREPGYIGSVESTQRIYGRVMQEHIDADHIRHCDGLSD